MKSQGTLNEEQAKGFMRQVLEGLEHMHSQSIVHGNLSLGNIFLGADWDVKIGGLSKVRLSKGSRPIQGGAATKSHKQSLRSESDALSPVLHGFDDDIWAFGVLMYVHE